MPKAEPVFIKIVITKDVLKKIEQFKKNWEGTDIMEVMIRLESADGHAYEIGGSMMSFLEKVGLGEVAEKALRVREGGNA